MLSPLQLKLLSMLKWFDSYCEQHKICYYIAEGSLLGAVRHGGFIPWDDDIDIIIPRSDYEKLINTFDSQGSQYELESPYCGNKDFLFSYSKLYDNSTTLTENAKVQCTRGIYIDLFPLDGVGDANWEKNYSKFDRLNMLLMTRTCSIRKGRGLLKNLSVLLMRMVPGFVLDNKKLSIKVDKVASQIDYESSVYVGNLMGAYRLKEVIKKDIIGKPTRYKFEDIYVYGPEKYDEYLTSIYGDWRKLPPKEKQVSHHRFKYLNLNKSYLED